MDEDAGEAFFIGGNMKEISLTKGKFAIVDDDDFEWLNQWKWCASSHGYAHRHIKTVDGENPIVQMHREILGLTRGDGKFCDHINGNTLDNQRKNLRCCRKIDNQRNQKTRSDNTSGFKGVSWYKRDKKWMAYIRINGNRQFLGYFSTPDSAHEAYKKAALENFGEFANFGDGCEILAKDS